jgi:hypothetical protein
MTVLKADGNTPADGHVDEVSVPLSRTAAGIPSVPIAKVVFSPAMTFEIRPALAKQKEKEFPPPPPPPYLHP